MHIGRLSVKVWNIRFNRTHYSKRSAVFVIFSFTGQNLDVVRLK